jgi:hypothetical protein
MSNTGQPKGVTIPSHRAGIGAGDSNTVLIPKQFGRMAEWVNKHIRSMHAHGAGWPLYDYIVDDSWDGEEGFIINILTGTKMYSTVQGAITAADADNDERSIFICPGEYDENVVVADSLAHALHIFGAGRHRSVVKPSSGAAFDWGAGNPTFPAGGGAYHTIADVGLDGTTYGLTFTTVSQGQRVLWTRCYFDGATAALGDQVGVDDHYFDDCDFNGDINIGTVNTSDFHFQNCRIVGNILKTSSDGSITDFSWVGGYINGYVDMDATVRVLFDTYFSRTTNTFHVKIRTGGDAKGWTIRGKLAALNGASATRQYIYIADGSDPQLLGLKLNAQFVVPSDTTNEVNFLFSDSSFTPGTEVQSVEATIEVVVNTSGESLVDMANGWPAVKGVFDDSTFRLTPPDEKVNISGGSNNLVLSGDASGSANGVTVYPPAAILNEPTGFPNRTDSALSFVSGTRTFTIAPSNGSFDYYQVGLKYTVSAADDIIISDVSGTHFLHYDGATLTDSVNPSAAAFDTLMVDKVLVGLVYWNATDGAAYILGDERHGTIMSGKTHEWLHDTIGASWSGGLTLSGYTLDEPDSDAALTLYLTDGEFHDQDIDHNIVDGTAANQYEQQLDGVADAVIPVLYREGDPGHWTEDAASTLPWKTAGGGNRLAYNSLAGSTYGQTEVTDGKWVSATLVATSDWQYPIKMIQGQNEYTDKKTAIEEATAEIIAFGTLPSPELVVLYRFVLQTKNSYNSTPNAQIVDVTDFRKSSLTGGVATAQDHGTLSGLGDDGHAQYLLEDGSRPLSADWAAGAGNLITAKGLFDADKDTGITVEDSADEDIIRAKTAGTERVRLSTALEIDATNLTLSDGAEQTISSGVITAPTATRFPIDTESGASSDELDTINGGADGRVIFIRPAHINRDIVLKHGTGNIVTPDAVDIALDSFYPVVILVYDGGDSKWHVLTEFPHNLLSPMHSDTDTVGAAQGRIIVGSAAPKWGFINVGAAGTFLSSDGTDSSWAAVPYIFYISFGSEPASGQGYTP